MENFFIWRRNFMKLGVSYFLRQQWNLQKNCSDQITILHSCHINCSIKTNIKIFLYPVLLWEIHCEGYYSCVFSCFCFFLRLVLNCWFCLLCCSVNKLATIDLSIAINMRIFIVVVESSISKPNNKIPCWYSPSILSLSQSPTYIHT